MNPDERLREAVKQATIAAESDHADDYAERIIDNAVGNLERASRRIQANRIEQEGTEGEFVDFEKWVAAGAPGDFETVREKGVIPDGGRVDVVVIPDVPDEQAEQVRDHLIDSGIKPERVEIREVADA